MLTELRSFQSRGHTALYAADGVLQRGVVEAGPVLIVENELCGQAGSGLLSGVSR